MWVLTAALIGCLARTAPDGSAAIESIYVNQQAPQPRLCLSPVPSAGKMRGDAPQAWIDAAQLIAAGDLVGAQVRLDAAPEHPGADALRGAVSLLSGDNDAARTTYRTLVNEHPEDGCVQITAAAIYMAEREPVMARTHATDAWRLLPEEPNAQYVYALAWMQAGDESRAATALRKVVAAEPGHPGAGYLLGSEYLQRGHVDMALPLLEAARAGGIDVVGGLAEAYFETRRTDDYVRLASESGWPLGDGGSVAEADDPGAAWRALLGITEGLELVAELVTSMGSIHCTLYWEDAPLTVSSFVGLARGTQTWIDPATRSPTDRPLYSGTVFHRVIPGFMIQAGDPLGTGAGSPGYRFHDEIRPEYSFSAPGVLAMANSGPDTNGSQFFITDGAAPHLTGAHTIFGECDEGSMDIVRQIARVPTDNNKKPLDDVTLHEIRITYSP